MTEVWFTPQIGGKPALDAQSTKSHRCFVTSLHAEPTPSGSASLLQRCTPARTLAHSIHPSMNLRLPFIGFAIAVSAVAAESTSADPREQIAVLRREIARHD